MTAQAASTTTVAVDGGDLTVHRWDGGGPTILGIHGITASGISFAPVARHLEGATLVAPDLRGRGGSGRLPGPYGMAAHADDCATVIRSIDDGPVVVVGESMGGFVSVVLAQRHPELVAALVLVDGGLPLPVPEGIDPDAVLEGLLGPSLARLRMTFESRPAYLDYWREHPAVAECWSEDVEAYLGYDVEGDEPALTSKVSEEAVRADGRDTLVNAAQIDAAAAGLTCPVHLIRAPRNLSNEPQPLLPDALVTAWKERLPQLTEEMVADTNHYSIVFGDRGARTIAARALAMTGSAVGS